MLKTIFQILFLCCIPMMSGEENVGQEYVSYIESSMEWENFERMELPTDMRITDTETLREVEKELEPPSDISYSIYIENSDLDTSALLEELEKHWQQNRKKNQYALSIAYAKNDDKGEEIMTPFLSLMEEECVAKVEEKLAQKGGYPGYIRLERVRGLNVYTVCVFIPDESDKEYIVVLNGIWKGQKVDWQAVTIPETAGYSIPYPFHRYFTAPLDINYDGDTDLFILEGYDGGSGGYFGYYKSLIWKEDSGEFLVYESFPKRVTSLEYWKQRIIESNSMGAFESHVIEYKVVDGEYTATRELAWTYSYDEAGNAISTLSYYEMGVLVREYDVTGMEYEEVDALYPDLDYWQRGG
ncbi:MAG: hypothetical protein NC231_09385 [Bacillus sp. (in: Bacteria)]|nr:hypothetical protein [Bacillus sp. (in: firmicutes)]MCM1425100.1 hypothetical protein [Eubacterium sp.]